MDVLELSVEQLQEVVINLHKRIERLEQQTLLHDSLISEFGGYLRQHTKKRGPDDLLGANELYGMLKPFLEKDK